MNRKQGTVRQYSIFLIGVFIAAMGVAFSTKAGLGTSPVASVPFSVSLVNHALSFGWWLNVWSLLQIAVEVLLLRSKCNPLEIAVQIVIALIYGYMTDFACWIIRDLTVSGYPAQLGFMLLGCVTLGFGVWLQFKGGVAMLAGEAMNRAIAQVTARRYENVKIFFDIAYILLAAVISVAFTGRLQGVREGSIIAALLIGNIIKGFNALYDRFIG